MQNSIIFHYSFLNLLQNCMLITRKINISFSFYTNFQKFFVKIEIFLHFLIVICPHYAWMRKSKTSLLKLEWQFFLEHCVLLRSPISGVDSGSTWGVRAPPELGGSEKGWSLISAYQSLAITAGTSGFEKLWCCL